jgi:hypothetical protein
MAPGLTLPTVLSTICGPTQILLNTDGIVAAISRKRRKKSKTRECSWKIGKRISLVCRNMMVVGSQQSECSHKAAYYDRTKDHWRTTAYRKAIGALKETRKISSKEEALEMSASGQESPCRCIAGQSPRSYPLTRCLSTYFRLLRASAKALHIEDPHFPSKQSMRFYNIISRYLFSISWSYVRLEVKTRFVSTK